MKIIILNNNDETPSEILIKLINNIILTKKNIELNIKITKPIQIKFLNKKYRNKNKHTDVLTFKNIITSKEHENIGDIVLCPKIMKKKQTTSYWEITIIHSILHILDYNHLETKDFMIMSQIEKKLKK